MIGINAIGYGNPYLTGLYGQSSGAESAGASAIGDTGAKVTLNPGESVEKKPGMRSSPAECETCKNRTYFS